MDADAPMIDRPDPQATERLLLDCVRATPDRDRIRATLDRPDFKWAAFWRLAAAQHVQPLVARTLADATLSTSLPPDAREATKAVRLQTTLTNMATQAELESIATLLSTNGIPSIPLKGTALAQRLFGSLGARRCGDIDILVPEADWQAAHQMLLAAGYRPAGAVNPGVERHAFHGVPLVKIANGRGYVIELHRQLTDPRFLTIDHPALWRRFTESGQAGLPAEELLVSLAVHAPKHDTGVLRLLADIDHLIARESDRIDWDTVVALARAWHADTILYFVLRLASALLSTPVADDVLCQIRPPGWKRAGVTFLVGPQTVLHPPLPLHLRANRFRIAYCLMLRHDWRELRSFWHYIMMPPRMTPQSALHNVTQTIRRPLDGIAWTALAVGSAVRDRYRLRPSTSS